MIGHEYHDGGIGHAGRLQMVEDAPDVMVEAGGHAVVGGAHRPPGRLAHLRVVQRRGADDAVDARPLWPGLPFGDVQRFAAEDRVVPRRHVPPAVRNRRRNCAGVVHRSPRFGNRERVVRIGEADVGEQRPPVIAHGIEQLDGAVGQVVRGVQLRGQAEAVRSEHRRQLVFALPRLRPRLIQVNAHGRGMRLVVGAETAVAVAVDQVHLGEPVVAVARLPGQRGLQHLRFGALRHQVDLADRRTPVAGALQSMAEKARIVRRMAADHARLEHRRKRARQQGSAARRTGRLGDHAVGEAHPRGGHAVQVRRAAHRIAVSRQGIGT